MDLRNYQASCAVCGSPAEPDCPSGCESERLSMAIDQAEAQWLGQWRDKMREWVANTAIRHVTQTFSSMKEVRLANRDAYVKALPYFTVYHQYRGNPPLHPHVIANIKREIDKADQDLLRNIDSDWRQCVVQYPKVLKHCYSSIGIHFPEKLNSTTSLVQMMPTAVLQIDSDQLLPSSEITAKPKPKSSASKQRSKTSSQESDQTDLNTLLRLLQESSIVSKKSRDRRSGHNLDDAHFAALDEVAALDIFSKGRSSDDTSADFRAIVENTKISDLNRLLGRNRPSYPWPDDRVAELKTKSRSNKTITRTGRATAPQARSPFDLPGPAPSWSNGPFAM